MSDLDPLRNLAQTLAYDPGQPVTMTKGVVQAYAIGGQPPTLDLYLSGDNTTLIEKVRFLDSYSPAIGDVVQVLKQGPMLLVLGQIAGGAAAGHSANGWVEPSNAQLGSGFTQFTNDPFMYRLILDNGSKKIQLRGRLNISGTPSTFFTFTNVDYRPALSLGPIAIARDPNGAATAQLDVQANGTLNLIAATTTASSAQHGNLTTSYYNTDHVHTFFDDGQGFDGTTDPNNDSTSASKYTFGGGVFNDGVIGGAAGDGGNSPNHRHTTVSAFHTHTVNFPTFISLNGVEYFI